MHKWIKGRWILEHDLFMFCFRKGHVFQKKMHKHSFLLNIDVFVIKSAKIYSMVMSYSVFSESKRWSGKAQLRSGEGYASQYTVTSQQWYVITINTNS